MNIKNRLRLTLTLVLTKGIKGSHTYGEIWLHDLPFYEEIANNNKSTEQFSVLRILPVNLSVDIADDDDIYLNIQGKFDNPNCKQYIQPPIFNASNPFTLSEARKS